ncbi:MAG: hypothetical protein WB383_08690 [Acidimicrobiales bacterium]
MAGHVISRTNPSRTVSSGRASVKSKNSSGSISANGAACQALARLVTAYDAAPAASFQPSKATTTLGSVRRGRPETRTAPPPRRVTNRNG